MSAHRILIAEDHPISRSGLRALLRTIDGVEVVGEAATGEDAVRLAHVKDATLVFMDVNMNGMSGIDATRVLKRERPATKVIILTVHEDEMSIVEAFRAGASAYLTKTASAEELRAALDSIDSDGVYLSPEVTGRVMRSAVRELMGDRRSGGDGGTSLTERERQVLVLLGDGMTSRAIAHRLGISERTVNTHVGNLYRRLGVNNRVDAVRAGMRAGLIETPV